MQQRTRSESAVIGSTSTLLNMQLKAARVPVFRALCLPYCNHNSMSVTPSVVTTGYQCACNRAATRTRIHVNNQDPHPYKELVFVFMYPHSYKQPVSASTYMCISPQAACKVRQHILQQLCLYYRPVLTIYSAEA